MYLVYMGQVLNYRSLQLTNRIRWIGSFECGLNVIISGSVAQWIARRTSSCVEVDIRRLWVRVPPESFVFAMFNFPPFCHFNKLLKNVIIEREINGCNPHKIDIFATRA